MTNDPKSALPASEDEWKQRLTPEQYRIARCAGTERAFTPGNLNDEKRPGLYKCVACGETLFVSDHKYDSGSGWPSFFQPAAKGAVGTSTDFKIGYPRTEVHCAKCGSHMGHVFDGGPNPTGLRYCINGAVLKFVPEKEGGKD